MTQEQAQVVVICQYKNNNTDTAETKTRYYDKVTRLPQQLTNLTIWLIGSMMIMLAPQNICYKLKPRVL